MEDSSRDTFPPRSEEPLTPDSTSPLYLQDSFDPSPVTPPSEPQPAGTFGPPKDSRHAAAREVALASSAAHLAAMINFHNLMLKDPSMSNSHVEAALMISDAVRRGGKLVVSGVGKSGSVGKKFKDSCNGLGITSVFLDPTNALHGDLGMIGKASQSPLSGTTNIITTRDFVYIMRTVC